MYLSTSPIYDPKNVYRRVLRFLGWGMGVGGVIVTLTDLFPSRAAVFIAWLLPGFFLWLGLSMIKSFLPRLLTALGVILLNGLIPTGLIWLACAFPLNLAHCQVNYLRAASFGNFAFPAIPIFVTGVFGPLMPDEKKKPWRSGGRGSSDSMTNF